MAKQIKVIHCPHCGSIHKREIKPQVYQCQNCSTEYYLDSDDTHIYHHYEQPPLRPSSAPPGNNRLPIILLIGCIAGILIIYGVVVGFQPKKASTYTVSNFKLPRMYYDSFVYTNTLTGDPVYLRLGTDRAGKGNGAEELETHAQFNRVTDGKLLVDRVVTNETFGKKRCALSFKTYAPDLIYAIGCNTQLVQLDVEHNELKEVTQEVFKDFPQLSSGVARLDFDYSKAMINVMNNEGKSYFYFPTIHRLVETQAQAEEVWKMEFDRHFFEFGYLGGPFDENRDYQLIETTYARATGEVKRQNLTPGRKYFAPRILHQDEQDLLIVVNTTAAPNPPLTIQRLDVKTGEILWALPPDTYTLQNAVKCRQGFAIEYRRGPEADYVHGVLVVSPTGKIIQEYTLSRTE
ncbi:hypothetical protein BWI97_20480 [Siphonobacter sp. BAB-5405]|uniref:hypothetical protein n=1 Tax=Siphonobacter sp. BAB-5405 TaxID=1864825 RepID=UPI000C803B22|nr:hypothetical protein [Siphonobacter sp. BAB-5405]PMD92467.1 hypothetical protein BWI97_20480 [Siphonobacter sp. BAB-5405]